MAMALAKTLSLAKRYHKSLVIGTCLSASLLAAPMASAQAQSSPITTVFYILLENRCFTSGVDKSYNNIIFQNANGASPYLTSLCTSGSNSYTFTYSGTVMPQNAHASFCSAYHNALTVTAGDAYPIVNSGTFKEPSGTNEALNCGGGVHTSEPNYIFMEAGSTLSKYDDNDPYGTTDSVAQMSAYLARNPGLPGFPSEPVTGENLSGLLQNAGISWTSYTEGTCLLNSNGQDYNVSSGSLTNNISPLGTRTVPLVSFSGSQATYTNPYNGTHEFNFACKHTGQLFFPATNGSTTTTANTSPSNVAVYHYAPLEQLASDLANNTQAQYCVITPDQYNDGHTALPKENFTYKGTTYTANTDLERIAQMDSFCSIVVPEIMNSPVYQNGHAAIVIWTDETEGSPQDDYYHTLTEIVISPYSKGNAYNSALNYTHSSDIATMQEIFGVVANTSTGYLNDAANPSNATQSGTTAIVNTGQGLQIATGQPFWGFGTGTALDLSDLFVPNTIPSSLPGLTLTPSGFAFNRKTNTYTQTVTVTNVLSQAISSPIYLVVGGSNTTLKNSAGTTSTFVAGSPYVSVSPSGLAAGASTTVTLQFAPAAGAITETLSTAVTAGTP